MKRLLPAVFLLLAACGAPQPRVSGPPLRPAANPSAVIAAELAFARLAQDKGQWTAFRATAAPDAEMFVPQRTRAQGWLRGRPDPAVAVTWQPHRVWSSCDGSLAVTTGAWQRGGANGMFTTVWTRQADGSYRWALDHGQPLPAARPAPEMIEAKVADCSGKPGIPLAAPAVGEDMKQAVARDQTLIVASSVAPDGARVVAVRLWTGATHETVLEDRVSAEVAR